MCRSTRALVLAAPALAALTLFAAACGSAGPEQQILANFFRASRVRDNVTLANLAAVTFDPRTDGSVQQFEIASISPEQRRPLQIAKLAEEMEAARKEDADFTAKKRAYQDANLDAIKRVLKAEGEKETLKGKDAEIQAAWAKWVDDQRGYQKKVAEARAKVEAERTVAVSSLTAPGKADVDVNGMDLELVSKQVTVNAKVQEPGGQTVPKTLVFTMQRAIGKKGGQTQEGRWLITGIKGGSAAAATS